MLWFSSVKKDYYFLNLGKTHTGKTAPTTLNIKQKMRPNRTFQIDFIYWHP